MSCKRATIVFTLTADVGVLLESKASLDPTNAVLSSWSDKTCMCPAGAKSEWLGVDCSEGRVTVL
jgi:hypothetical protein